MHMRIDKSRHYIASVYIKLVFAGVFSDAVNISVFYRNIAFYRFSCKNVYDIAVF